MSLHRKIAYNTITQVAGKAVAVILSLFIVGLLTRQLGTSGYGQYTTIISFLQFFGILVDFGLYIILIKMISAEPESESKIVSNIFTLRLVTATIVMSLSPLVALLFPYPAIVKWGIALCSIYMWLATVSQVLAGLYQKHLRMELQAITEVVSRFAVLIATLIVVWLNKDLLWIIGTLIVGGFVHFVLTYFWAKKLTSFHLAWDFDFWKKILKESWPVAVAIGFNIVYFKADTIILSLFRPASEVGLYGAPYKMLETLVALPAIFGGLMMPLVASSFAKNAKDEVKKFIQQSFDVLCALAVPMIFGTLALANQIMVFLAGQDFLLSGKILQILILATAAIFISNFFSNTLVMIHEQRKMIKLYGWTACLALAGYFILIPIYSFWAAAWVTVLVEILVMLVSVKWVLKKTEVSLSYQNFGKIILASIIMWGVLLIVRYLPLAFGLLLGIAVYGGLIWIFKVFPRELAKEIFSKNKNIEY